MCHRAVLRLTLTLTLMLTLALAVLPVAPAEAATTYKVTYYANGGKGAPSAQTKKKGVTLKLSAVKPTRATYTFKGWSTSASATSASYKPGASYTGNKALKLYAVWHLNYVALGDSYSSGEGAKPKESESQFLADSAFGGTRACHRSPLAYGKLLDTRLNLELKAFGACSGATTRDVTSQQKKDKKTKIAKAQLDYVNSGTGLITLTMGGNDIDFAQIVKYCGAVDTGCTYYSPTVREAVRTIKEPAFEATLATTYSAILTRASKAKLLVIGYPLLGPGKDSKGKFRPMCPSSYFGRTYPDAQVQENLNREISQGIHTIVNELNAVIKRAVAKAAKWHPGRAFYVSPTSGGDPFKNHELCSSKPYVNDLISPLTARAVYSFHPNHLGHDAYAKIVSAYIKGKGWAK